MDANDYEAWRQRTLRQIEADMLADIRRAATAHYFELPAIGECMGRFYEQRACTGLQILINESRLGPLNA